MIIAWWWSTFISETLNVSLYLARFCWFLLSGYRTEIVSFIYLIWFDLIWFDLLWNFTSQNWPLWADLFICLEKICLRYSWLRLTRYLYVLVWYFSFFFTFSCHILTKKLSSMYFFLFSLKQGKVHSLLNWVKHQPSSNTQLNIHWFFLTNSVRIIFFLEYFQNNV